MKILSKKLNLKFVLIACVFGYIVWTYQHLAVAVIGKSINFKNSSKVLSTNSTSSGEKIEFAKPCGAPTRLVGPLKIDFDLMTQSYLENSEPLQNERSFSLAFEPLTCKPHISVAIIIPFRDRQQHLEYLLGHLHPILKHQLIRYQIFLVEQMGNFTFNKGRLMNTGFDYVKNKYGVHFDCYIFHDVDMLPENDRNIYRCNPGSNAVRHLSCSVNKFHYKTLCCGMTVGGVLSFTEDQFKKVNGFPNDYWGWGGEDDDMNTRIKIKGLKVVRPSFSLCRYHMIQHKPDELNHYVASKVNTRVAQATKLLDNNGLNDLNTTVLYTQRHPLYVHLYVDVGLPDT